MPCSKQRLLQLQIMLTDQSVFQQHIEYTQLFQSKLVVHFHIFLWDWNDRRFFGKNKKKKKIKENKKNKETKKKQKKIKRKATQERRIEGVRGLEEMKENKERFKQKSRKKVRKCCAKWNYELFLYSYQLEQLSCLLLATSVISAKFLA